MNYYTVWKIFSNFLIKLDFRPNSWEDRLTLFVGHLINTNKQSSTVKCYISAIKVILKEDGFEISEDQYLLSSLVRACKLQNDQIKPRLPIKKGLLSIILRQIEKHYRAVNQPYLLVLYKAVFSTMYFGLLRVSEVAAGPHPVLVKDVHIGKNKRKFMLLLHTSKTHWRNSKPQIIKISSRGCQSMSFPSSLPCPYQVLRDYASYHRNYLDEEEQFFVFADKLPITHINVRNCLRLMLKQSGFDEHLYCTHSIRIGHSCDLFKLGLSVETIKKLGRWKSNAVFKYIRQSPILYCIL